MPQAITDGTMSKRWLKFNPDAIWSAEALPDSTTKTTDEFEIGKDQGGVAIYATADTTVAIAAGQILKVQQRTGDATTGVYDTTTAVYEAPANGVTFEIGEFIFDFIPADTGRFSVLDFITDADESGDTISVDLRYLSR